MYCKCGNKLPKVRVKAGYKTCVECSTEEKWGCSQVVYHKTGNTIEVIKDKELCEQINAMAKRPAFGVCVGVKGTIRKKEVPFTTRRVSTREPVLSYNEIGQKAMRINDKAGIEETKIFVDRCVEKHWISRYSGNRIITIIEAINNAVNS